MVELVFIFLASVLLEALYASYIIKIATRRIFAASVISGLIALFSVTVFINIVEKKTLLSIIIYVIGHAYGTFLVLTL